MELVGVRVDLRGSSFRKARLWGADLYGLDLSDADFSEAWLNATSFKKTNLRNANFTNAHMEPVKEKNKLAALFADADLAGAKFTGACLGAADFRAARNLSVDQFRDAFAQGATFDAGFMSLLTAANAVRSDPKCTEY
jgi:uncharacterized protein YjbI with pentapeptide repeats